MNREYRSWAQNYLFDSLEDGFDKREKDSFEGDLVTNILEDNKDNIIDSLKEDFDNSVLEGRIISGSVFDDKAVYYLDLYHFRWYVG